MKLMICIPLSWPWCPTDFVVSVLQVMRPGVLKALKRFGIEQYFWMVNRNFPLDSNRQMLVEEALKLEVEWTLWLDADMVFPPDLIPALCERQAKTGEAIISGTYFSKWPPHKCVGGNLTDPDPQLIVPPEIPTDKGPHGLIPVDVIGMGCALIHTDVFKDLVPPWFAYGRYKKTGRMTVSEDVFFCNEARKKGWKLWIDPDIRCGHIGTTVFEQGHNLAYAEARERLIEEPR